MKYAPGVHTHMQREGEMCFSLLLRATRKDSVVESESKTASEISAESCFEERRLACACMMVLK
jgi:hypothetical protein